MIRQKSYPKLRLVRDDTYAELRRKAVYYLNNGAKLVWLIYPDKRLVEVYTSPEDSELLTENDTLEGSDVLPGFKMLIGDSFKD